AAKPAAATERATRARRHSSAICRARPTGATGCASRSGAGRSRSRGTRRRWRLGAGPRPGASGRKPVATTRSSSRHAPSRATNHNQRRNSIIDYRKAAGAILAALDDSKRSQIGDPRKGVYSISFTTTNMEEAKQLPKDLVAIGVVPVGQLEYDPQFGHAIGL